MSLFFFILNALSENYSMQSHFEFDAHESVDLKINKTKKKDRNSKKRQSMISAPVVTKSTKTIGSTSGVHDDQKNLIMQAMKEQSESREDTSTVPPSSSRSLQTIEQSVDKGKSPAVPAPAPLPPLVAEPSARMRSTTEAPSVRSSARARGATELPVCARLQNLPSSAISKSLSMFLHNTLL